jgi:mono/diheme cytochrome c family protein
MKPMVPALLGSLVTVALAAAAGLGYVSITGLRASDTPSSLEEGMARRLRRFAVPRAEARRINPIAPSEAGLAEGLAHYADHCASCHAVDGSGNTELGRGLFPKAPDMRQSATQSLTDGELFYVIEHGIRFTGMPAWSIGTPAGEAASWQLVHAIRQLPRLSDDEKSRMEELTPRSADAVRQEIAEENFLSGGDEPSSSTHGH